jgi:hypothetical protein
METRSVSEELTRCASLTHRVTIAAASVFRKVTIKACSVLADFNDCNDCIAVRHRRAFPGNAKNCSQVEFVPSFL